MSAPPGTRTRAISARPASRSGTWYSIHAATTVSNEPSANGSSWTSPSRASTPRACASSTIRGERSTNDTSAPSSRCIRSASSPSPPPTSSTRRGCHASSVRQRISFASEPSASVPQRLAGSEIGLVRVLLAHDGLVVERHQAFSATKIELARRAKNGSGTTAGRLLGERRHRDRCSHVLLDRGAVGELEAAVDVHAPNVLEPARRGSASPSSRENFKVDGPLPTSSRSSSRWKREFVTATRRPPGRSTRASSATPRSRSGTW